jgi:hypothetical protein
MHYERKVSPLCSSPLPTLLSGCLTQVPDAVISEALSLAQKIHLNILAKSGDAHAHHATSACVLGYGSLLYGGGYYLAENPPWSIPATKVALSLLTSMEMLTERIPLIFWYDPIGKRTLLDFVLSELEMLRPFVHTQTILFDLRTHEQLQLQNIFPNHCLAFGEPHSPLAIHARGESANHAAAGVVRAQITPMPHNIDDPKIIELLLPDIKIAVAHSYSNGVDRPIRKAHSAAILIRTDGQLEIVIAKNFRHPTIGYLARCSEAIGIAFAQSEGLFLKRHQIDHVVVYSPDYRSRDSSELHPPAVCGTCESVISSYSGDNPSGVLITTMSDTTQTHYQIMHGLYSKLEKVIL